ncbi:MAG: response regulator [bacterium]
MCKIQEELAGRTLPGGNFRIIVQPVHQNDLLASLVFSLIAGEDNCKDAQGDSMPQDGRYAHTFSIPLSPGNPPVSVTKTMERVILPRRILLAEDNDSNCFVATTFLTKFGYTVKCASNGQDVLELLPRENFDIILMDVQMPVLDGLETTKRIRTSRSRQWDPDIPIIALTAYAMKGDRERFLAAGMDEYVAKPVKFRDLFGTMDRVVLRKRLEKNASENHRF